MNNIMIVILCKEFDIIVNNIIINKMVIIL